MLIQSIDKCFIRSSTSDEKKKQLQFIWQTPSEGRQWLDKWLLMTHKRLLRGLLEGEWTPTHPSFCSECMNHGDQSVCPVLLITTVVCGPPLNKLYLLIFLEMKGHHLTHFFFFFLFLPLSISPSPSFSSSSPSKLEHFLSSCLKAFWEKKWF